MRWLPKRPNERPFAKIPMVWLHEKAGRKKPHRALAREPIARAPEESIHQSFAKVPMSWLSEHPTQKEPQAFFRVPMSWLTNQTKPESDSKTELAFRETEFGMFWFDENDDVFQHHADIDENIGKVRHCHSVMRDSSKDAKLRVRARDPNCVMSVDIAFSFSRDSDRCPWDFLHHHPKHHVKVE